MAEINQRFRALFRPARPVPVEYRRNFLHLYMEIAWYGILGGTTLAFLGVYATRQGASAQQIGLLSALPAMATLFVSLPIGVWLGRSAVGPAVFWMSVFQRLCYLLFILLPVFFLPDVQVWLIILISLVMTLPGTAVTVGFTALFAEVVPVEYRGHVVGVRTGLLAIITTLFSWLSGWMLDTLPFPMGYQVVFALGFFGTAMSSLHLYFLMPAAGRPTVRLAMAANGTRGSVHGNGYGNGLSRQLADLSQVFRRGTRSLRLDVLNGPFARLMGLLFFFHFTQFLAIPVVTPFTVNELKYSDQLIGLGGGIFNIAIFLGSMRLSTLTGRWGNKLITAAGIMSMGSFPALMAVATTPIMYIVANIAGGLAWSLAGGGLYNYLLDNVPPTDRPAYLAWYSMISNGAILFGSLLGPALAGQVGFTAALLLFGLARLLAGIAILRWG